MMLRVRGPQGQVTLRLQAGCTVDTFRKQLAEATGVPAERQEVRGGFPPQLISFPADGATDSLSSLGIQSGDSLTVTQLPLAASAVAVPTNGHAAAPAAAAGPTAAAAAALSEDEQLARAIALSLGQDVPELAPAAEAAPPPSTTTQAAAQARARATSPPRAHPKPSGAGSGSQRKQGAPTSVSLPDGSAVTRRIIDSDNSCLFNAVGYVTQRSRKLAPQLRQVIADAVLADPFEWNEGVLGKEPAEYCRWIKDPSKWGGGIELSILSRHLGREIAAFDIQTNRVVAAFDGAPEQLDVTVLPSTGLRTDTVMQGAKQLAAAAHAARQFTDTANFTLRCGVCQIGLKGEKEAVEHAKATGHSNFAEY